MAKPYTTPLGHAIRPRTTLRAIAERAGVSYSFVAKISQGIKPCSPRVAEAIRDLLHLEPEDFFTERKRR